MGPGYARARAPLDPAGPPRTAAAAGRGAGGSLVVARGTRHAARPAGLVPQGPHGPRTPYGSRGPWSARPLGPDAARRDRAIWGRAPRRVSGGDGGTRNGWVDCHVDTGWVALEGRLARGDL